MTPITERRATSSDAPAVEEAQELVAAERAIGAQDEQRLLPVVGHVRPRPNGDESFVDGVEEELVRAVPEQLLSDVRTREGNDEEDDDEDRRDCEPIPPEADPDLLPVARAFTSAGASVSTKTSVGTGSSVKPWSTRSTSVARSSICTADRGRVSAASFASAMASSSPTRRARARAPLRSRRRRTRALSRNADACVLGSRLIAASSSMPTTLGRARRVMSIRLPTCVRCATQGAGDTGELTPAADSELSRAAACSPPCVRKRPAAPRSPGSTRAAAANVTTSRLGVSSSTGPASARAGVRAPSHCSSNSAARAAAAHALCSRPAVRCAAAASLSASAAQSKAPSSVNRAATPRFDDRQRRRWPPRAPHTPRLALRQPGRRAASAESLRRGHYRGVRHRARRERPATAHLLLGKIGGAGRQPLRLAERPPPQPPRLAQARHPCRSATDLRIVELVDDLSCRWHRPPVPGLAHRARGAQARRRRHRTPRPPPRETSGRLPRPDLGSTLRSPFSTARNAANSPGAVSANAADAFSTAAAAPANRPAYTSERMRAS